MCSLLRQVSSGGVVEAITRLLFAHERLIRSCAGGHRLGNFLTMLSMHACLKHRGAIWCMICCRCLRRGQSKYWLWRIPFWAFHAFFSWAPRADLRHSTTWWKSCTIFEHRVLDPRSQVQLRGLVGTIYYFCSVCKGIRIHFVGVDETIYYFCSVCKRSRIQFLGVDETIQFWAK